MKEQDGMYRAWLIPYLAGALDAGRHAEIEERLADDPALAAEMYALRRALPQLRARLAPPADGMEAAPLWPHLRDRLQRTRRRQVRPALLRFAIGALLLAVLLPLSSVNRHWAARQDRQAEAKWRREMRRAPRIVFGQDSTPGTRTARRLVARARRVAAERCAGAFPPSAAASL